MVKYNTKKSFKNPYYYKGHIRIFCKNLTSNELVWHRDKGHRVIKVVSGENWFLQLDDCLPKELKKNKLYKVPSAIYHRLINKSNDDLKIKILEYK